MLRNFGGTEIVVILLVLVLLFGARRIPELARSLGKSLTAFKKGREEGLEENSPKEDDSSPEK